MSGRPKTARKYIFELTGVLRELAPYGIDLFSSCPLGCKYCFSDKEAPWRDRVYNRSFFGPLCYELGIFDYLRREYNDVDRMVLISPYTEPYPEPYRKPLLRTRSLLKNFLKHKIPCAILTKMGLRIMRDVWLIRRFGASIKVGTTLVAMDDEWKRFERKCAPPLERVEMLKKMKEKGVRTFVCLMPILDSDWTIKVIEYTKDFADEYFVGPHFVDGKICRLGRGRESVAKAFEKIVEVLRYHGKRFYVEERLREYTGAFLTLNETRRGDFYTYNDGLGELQ